MRVVQTLEPETDVRAVMREVGAKARAAGREVANAPAERKNRALVAGARILRERAAVRAFAPTSRITARTSVSGSKV